jgi:hypothetical protein
MYTRRPQAVQLILQLPSIEYNSYTMLYIYISLSHYFLLPSLCPYLWIILEAPKPTAPIVPCPEKVDQQVRRYDLSYGSTVRYGPRSLCRDHQHRPHGSQLRTTLRMTPPWFEKHRGQQNGCWWIRGFYPLVIFHIAMEHHHLQVR